MTAIDSGGGGLQALVRAQLTALRTAPGTGPGTGAASPGAARSAALSPGSTPPAGGTETAEARLAQQTALRLRAIHPDDPQRHRKAFRIYMESVLLQQFGTALQHEDGFANLVDQVVAQMEEDPSLSEASRAAAEVLLHQARAEEHPRP